MVFRDSLQNYFAFLKQFKFSFAKSIRENFINFHEAMSQIYPGSNVKLLERTKDFATYSSNSLRGLMNPLYFNELLSPQALKRGLYGGRLCSRTARVCNYLV